MTTPPQTTDHDKVLSVIDRLDDGATIDHGTARTIASWWAEGNNLTAMSFASTGRITTPHAVWDALTDNGTLYDFLDDDCADKLALDALATYLTERGEQFPVFNWCSMWVPALDECYA